jgi:hypothetical protein
MGNKHPGLMRPAEQVWGEIWPTVGPMLGSVLAASAGRPWTRGTGRSWAWWPSRPRAQVMTRLAPAGGYEDDVALVVYHYPAPLDVSFSAESEQLASVRTRLTSVREG